MLKKTFSLGPRSLGLYVVLSLLAMTLAVSNQRVEGSDGESKNIAARSEPSAAATSSDSEAARTSEAAAPVVTNREAPKKARKGSDRVFECEQLLSNLGYWTGPVDGILDPASTSAVMAFQKVEGLRRTGKLTAADIVLLREAASPKPLEIGYAHVEVDIAKQVLYFVDAAGKVSNVLPVSTGNGKPYSVKGVRDVSYTPRGRCTVYRKIAGERVAPLGSIYYPNYLVGGIAIHGSPSIPAYPASHGCVRIPMWACKEVSARTPVGTVVLIHEGGDFANEKRWLDQVARYTPDNYNDSMAAVR